MYLFFTHIFSGDLYDIVLEFMPYKILQHESAVLTLI
jgi:hypothetical protein